MNPPKKETKLPEAFSATIIKTERACVAKLAHWMINLIDELGLDLGPPEVDTSAADGLSPDLVIYESKRSQNTLCVLEAKRPKFDVYNAAELIEPARKKATNRRSPYFATTNFRELVWFDTTKVNANAPEPDQIINTYQLSEVVDLNKIDHSRYQESIKKKLKVFLLELYKVHHKKEPKPQLPLDERLIRRIHSKVKRLAEYYAETIEDKAHKDRDFAADLKNWFVKQGWSFAWRPSDFEKVARQTAYLLSNKILFYMALQAKRPADLNPLDIPKNLTKGDMLKSFLEAYFNRVLKFDYEEIYTTDFIDSIAFPDVEEIVEEVKEFVNILTRYNFAQLGYEIIGRIFEKLIPAEERHQLGQYFTNSDVVDIILRFCHQHEEDKVLDPSCGAGTFLVRAYQHKQLMNPRKEHEEILQNLWGNDISKFPAHLASINLAIRDLSVIENYPNILEEDFFNIQVGKEGCSLPVWQKKRAKTLNKKPIEVNYPHYFDAIVGNPPYTRQEELKEISKEYGQKKENLITNSLLDLNGDKLANLSKRAGIHAYFFIHGWKFLKEGGYFGFIVSNSWLDVGYGAGLQEFFLKRYKIVAIIESKVERWFADADVNTCIVILQKCSNEAERDQNYCRFAYLKKRLSELIPPAEVSFESQKHRFNQIDLLKQTIFNHDNFYENDDLRIYPVKQADLWKEGYDDEEKKFVGAKWGKYLRAPKIFFTILEKGKGKLVPLKEVAKVRRGFTTGANEFFYLTEEQIKRKRIDRKHVQPIIFSLKEIETYRIDKKKLTKRVIICWRDREKLYGTKLFEYIKWAEKKEINTKPTCASREPWYALGKNWEYAPLIFPAKVGERMPVFLNDDVYEDKKLYGILPKKKDQVLLLAALLNSTVSRFFIEFTCRQLTGSQAIADIDVNVVQTLLVIYPKNIAVKLRQQLIAGFEKLCDSKSESIFNEIANSVDAIQFDKIKPDRRALDSIIMGDILGLTDDEQLEVYRAVVDLVRSRLDKAKSVESDSAEDQEEMDYAAGDVLDNLKDNSRRDS